MKAVGQFSHCGSPLHITEDRRTRIGFVIKMDLCCLVCDKTANIMDPYSNDDLQVNTRAILAARIGRGRNGLATFAGTMGMPPPLTRPHTTIRNEEDRGSS